MYKLVFGRPKSHVTLMTGTLMECIRARFVSGDLILDSKDRVLQGKGWLFPWERLDPDCYAQRMQKEWTH